MRVASHRYAALLAGLAGLLAATTGVATSASAAPRQEPPSVRDEVDVAETPNAVAVANDGTIAASLYNDRSIALVPGTGVVRRIALDCPPSDVAIAPDASTAWAVCQADPHVYVIDVASGERLLADVGLREAEDVVYLPGPRRLVIADLAGEVVVVSATSNQDYEVLERVVTGAERPSDIAMLPSGSRGFAMTDSGRLLAIDITTRTSRVMSGLARGVFLSGIALSRSGTLLYAGAAIESNESGYRSAILALDPVTAKTVQESPLEFTPPDATPIKVAAGHRSLSVATGLGIQLDGESTGLFDVALDDQGRMGERTRIMPAGVVRLGSDVSRSADGKVIAAGTTNGTVVDARVDDVPYPPTLRVQGRLTGTSLTLTGTSTGIPAGTRVTVYIRDLTKPKQRFVKQASTTLTDEDGAYRWTGTVRPTRVQVYAETSTPAVSPVVTITRAKR